MSRADVGLSTTKYHLLFFSAYYSKSIPEDFPGRHHQGNAISAGTRTQKHYLSSWFSVGLVDLMADADDQ